ncbi:hypothetical protein, partial [Plasmodium yoelii yoelii]
DFLMSVYIIYDEQSVQR